MDSPDQKFMRRALELAKQGLYTTAPNPMVGAVIVHDGQIIGEGFHYKAGLAHAEVNAIAAVKNPKLLEQSSIYVSLEPCAHFGRTPPCSDLIIEKRIPTVFVATRDFNAQVNGKGIEKMKKAGIEVHEGIMEKEARELNRKFFTFHGKQRPYLTLKWAQSADGFMDPPRNSQKKGIQWISHPHSQVYSHQLRAQNQAILVGRNTIETDDPSLDCRAFKGNNPLRLILDPRGKLNTKYKVFRDKHYLRFIKEVQDERDLTLNDSDILGSAMEQAFKQGIQSILVEGGGKTLSSFIDQDLWDEIHIIEAPYKLGGGLKAPKVPEVLYEERSLGADTLKIYRK